MMYQSPLPPEYSRLDRDEMIARIRDRKRELGSRLVILGHHYQEDDVIQFADFVGDSLKLSQIGAAQKEARFIVFCGVHFMAESADILSPDHVQVILPDLTAGCSMADMADLEQVEEAWDFLAGACGVKVVPVTYVNSTAAIKAFCGARGGACCTSSNAGRVLEWALRRGDKVLFLPDQHLGRNTAYAMGIPLEEMVVYDPALPTGGLEAQDLNAARILLWKGHCSVHTLFTPAQCDEVRRAIPDCRILVHPECTWDVVQKADLAGSTEFIIKTLREAPSGSAWAVGTEIHLVNRLIRRHADKRVRSLAGIQCLCTTMYRIDLKHLLWALDNLAAGNPVNRIRVDDETKRLARLALDRMLSNVSSEPAAIKA